MTAFSKRKWAWPVIAIVAFLAAWTYSSHRVALYDGVGFPDEPYRFVHPTAGAATTKPPTSGAASSAVSNGTTSDSLYVNSAEQGPQVSVFVPAGQVHAPGARTVRLTAAPMAPDHAPAGARIDGNIYRLAATTTPSSATARYQRGHALLGSAGIVLRATTGRQPGPVMIYRPTASQPWRQVPTARVGNDIYRANLAGFGDYALAWGLHPVAPGSSTGGSSGGLILILVVVFVFALIALLVGVRVSRRTPDTS